MEKPFDLGALSDSIDHMTSTIYFSVKGFNKSTFKFVVTSEGMYNKKSTARTSLEYHPPETVAENEIWQPVLKEGDL